MYVRISCPIIIGTFVYICMSIASCSFVAVRIPFKSLSQRLESFPQTAPIESSAQIRWSKRGVPFVEASSNRDGFFLLGATHAHLRLGQMELLKRLASGRISELIGPFAQDLDHTIRILDLGRNSMQVMSKMNEETREILSSFVAGINWYQKSLQSLPPEFEIFQMKREEWTEQDVILVTRLAGVDLSWMFYFGFLSIEGRDLRDSLWERFLREDDDSERIDQLIPSQSEEIKHMSGLIRAFSRSGSNALAISGQRTLHGSALIASDPHLGTTVPNFWLLAGLRTPDFRVVGMMIPGTPFFALGRNEDIAWGGTNLRAISTHLYQVSEEKLSVREETIRTRWWFDTTRIVRESSHGPIISDSPFFDNLSETIALNWVGHEAISDEISSFLSANRARTFHEFMSSFESYGVSGQNMLYGDSEGHIGHLLAYQQPVLQEAEMTSQLIKNPDNIVESYRSAAELPHLFDPMSGYLSSANNQVFRTHIPISFSYANASRALRMSEIIESKTRISIEDLKALQQDVTSIQSVQMRNFLLQFVGELESKQIYENPNAAAMYEALKNWDGLYSTDSRGALAFHLLLSHMVPELLQRLFPNESEHSIMLKGDLWYADLKEQLKRQEFIVEFSKMLTKSLLKMGKKFTKYESWGNFHQYRIQYPLGRIPVIGSRFRFDNFAAPGSNNTLYKSAHSFSAKPHFVSYGAQARFISDLSSLDENYFVLLGGQDGWLKAENFLDQLPLWKSGEYMQLPLSTRGIEQVTEICLSIEPSPSL